MKNKNCFFLILIFTAICIINCVSGSPNPYSFAPGESQTATMTFLSTKNEEGVDLFYFEEEELPLPEIGKYWKPVIFPADRPLTLTLNVYGGQLDGGRNIQFECPALTPGRQYSLGIIQTKKKFLFFGENRYALALTDLGTKAVIFQKNL